MPGGTRGRQEPVNDRMLSERRAAWLARGAAWRRRDGSRRLLARPAWNRLVRAGDAGDQAAAEAVWRAWLQNPDDEGWELLTRWRPPSPAEAACAAAITGNGAVAAFCARRGLAPADPARRAAFFLLTGQAGQLRAADPDGALLALAYAGAGQDERARLRAAMAGTGDFDLMRVVARGDRPRTVAADPGCRRFAVVDDGLLWMWLLDAETGRASQCAHKSRLVTGVCFHGPDRLAVSGHRKGWCDIELYRLEGDGLELLAERAHPYDYRRCQLITIPHRGEIAILGGSAGSREVRYFDAKTLAEVTGPRELAGPSRTALWSSPDGRHHALGGVGPDGRGEVHVTLTPPGAAALGVAATIASEGDIGL
jgi:hypothetical protein